MPTLLPFTLSGAAPFVETFTFSTDVGTSVDGSEVRRRKRTYAHMRYSFAVDEVPGLNAGLRELLLAEADFVVPLVLYAYDPRTGSALAGRTVDPQLIAYTLADGSLTMQPADALVPAAAVRATPCAAGVLATDTALSHSMGDVRTAGLELRAQAFREQPTPWAGAYDTGLPLMPASWLDYSGTTSETLSRVEEELELGAQVVVDLLHRTRTLDAQVALLTLADTLQFRAFLQLIGGRYGAFRAVHPAVGELRTYRLVSDAIELAHMPGGYAVSKLSLKELP